MYTTSHVPSVPNKHVETLIPELMSLDFHLCVGAATLSPIELRSLI